MPKKPPAKFDASIPLDPAPQKFGDDVPIETDQPAATPTAPPQKSFIDRLTEIQKPDPSKKWNISEAGKAIGNIGAGGLGVLLHPINTLESIGGMITAPVEMATGTPFSKTVPGQMVQQFKDNPLGTVEGSIGAAGATAGLEKVPEVAGKVARSGAELVTGTSPKILTKKGGIVPETQEANADAAAKADATNLKSVEAAAKKNAQIAADRAQELKDFHQKVSDVRAQNELQSGTMTRKDALNRGVEHLDSVFKDDLTRVRDRAADEANAKYTQLNTALDPIEADPEFLPDALDKAMEKIKGSDTEPTILKDISKKVQRADEPMTYRDLQGYYSELGRELKRGTLPGDVYTAFDTLQEAIGDEMQRIADQNGLGPQLLDARQSWKQLKQTFYDPKSPVTKALKSTERGDAIKQFQGKDQTGIEAIAKYDPDLASRANTIRGYQAEAKGIRPSTKPPKAEPTLGPPTPPVTPEIVTPEVKSITPADIQQAKAQALANRAQKIQTRGAGIVTTLAAYRALADAFHGNFAALPSLFGESALGIGTTYGIGKILENPTVVEKLTKPTARDVAMIPPELAKDMGPIIDAAKAKGIKVSPALLTAVSAASSSKWYNQQ